MSQLTSIDRVGQLPPNPYSLGIPVSGARFFGRESLFREIEEYLSGDSARVIVLYGQRRIGKTSLLHQIAGYRTPPEYHAIFFDLQPYSMDSTDEVLYRLADKIAGDLGLPPPARVSFDQRDYFRSEFLPQAYSVLPQKQLLILFDEFDALSSASDMQANSAIRTFFPRLHELIEKEPRLAFILAIGRQISDLPDYFQSVFKGSYFRTLGLLEPEEAHKLIGSAFPDLDYTAEAVNRILKLAAGHPYCTQELCYAVFDLVTKSSLREVSDLNVDEVIDSAVERAKPGLQWIWGGSSAIEHVLMSALSVKEANIPGLTIEDINEVLRQLEIDLAGIDLGSILHGLVQKEYVQRTVAGQYQFRVDFIRRWVRSEHPVDLAKPELKSAVIDRLLDTAKLAYSIEDLETSENQYRQILAIKPGQSEAMLGLAQISNQRRDYSDALKWFEQTLLASRGKAVEGVPQPDSQKRLARLAEEGFTQSAVSAANALEDASQLDDAIKTLERAIDLY